jgi:uncharacterized membrane protein
MSDIRAADPAVVQRNWALAVYVLYLLSSITAVTSLIGVIMAHLKVNEASAVWRTHFAFQIRTFWWGLLAGFIGVVMCLTVILIPVGILLFVLLGIWFIARSVVGLVKTVNGEPIPAPHSLLLGL